MFGSQSHSANRTTCPAERVAVHYSAQMGVLAQTITEQFMAAAEEFVAAQRSLFTVVECWINEFRKIG